MEISQKISIQAESLAHALVNKHDFTFNFLTLLLPRYYL